MGYTIQKLATLAGVSVRTLHYYDAIGLLKPAHIEANGYRVYEEQQLLRLQQIMFFREIDLPLKEIRQVLDDPHFNIREALAAHRRLVMLKRKRMDELLRTIDKTLTKITNKKSMDDKELYDGFSKEEAAAYAKEAKERWGDTAAYKQSVARYGSLSESEKVAIQRASDALMKEIAGSMSKGATSEVVQALIAKHYNNLRHYYEPSTELYRGLADMYVADERFTRYFEKYAPGLATFMRDAMHAYCDALR
jgi:DNA-binding transcriptional MerR regulator